MFVKTRSTIFSVVIMALSLPGCVVMTYEGCPDPEADTGNPVKDAIKEDVSRRLQGFRKAK